MWEEGSRGRGDQVEGGGEEDGGGNESERGKRVCEEDGRRETEAAQREAPQRRVRLWREKVTGFATVVLMAGEVGATQLR